MTRPIVNPGTVTWAGDHLLLYLKPPGTVEDTTLVSYYRTLYSPAGGGHTALVLSDIEADGWGDNDLRAVYTDNKGLTDWIRKNVVRRTAPLKLTDDEQQAAPIRVRPGSGRRGRP